MNNNIVSDFNKTKEIPYEVITAIPIEGGVSTVKTEIPIQFVNKRKATKTRIQKLIQTASCNADSSLPPTIEIETYTLRNGLFKLEIPPREVFGCIFVSHPDLPKRSYSYSISLTKNSYRIWNFMDLLRGCGEVNSRVLAGNYFYDPLNEFFVLDNRTENEELQKRAYMGEQLSVNEKKLVPGNKYIINTTGSFCNKLIYLGEVSNIIVPNYYNYGCTFNPISYHNYQILYENRLNLYTDGDNFKLFKDDYDNYYISQKRSLRTGGLIEENVEKAMSNQDFHDLCSRNDWILGLNCVDNKDQMKRIIKDQIIHLLSERRGKLSVGRLMFDHTNWWDDTDLSLYSSSDVVDRINRSISNNDYVYGPHTSLIFSVFEKNTFGMEDDEIRLFFKDIWLSYFGKE